MENSGPGSRGVGYGVPGCGKHGVWKILGLVENTGCGKHGVGWKTRGVVENSGSGGKHGVWWKTWALVENTGSQWKTRGLGAKHGGTIILLNNEV